MVNNYNQYTTKVDLDTSTKNEFTSELAEKVFNTGTEWDAVKFIFHTGSEHTINGERHDLEMQTIH